MAWAESIGVSAIAIRRFEAGDLKPSLEVATKMSLLSGVDVISGTGKPMTQDEARMEYLLRCLQRVQVTGQG